MRTPIDSPAAWRAADIAALGRWLRPLTEPEVEAVAAMLQAVRDTGKPMLELTRDDAPLGAFAPVLEELTEELEHGIGFKTLRGLPSERFSVDDNRLLFWAVGCHLGVARPQGKACKLLG